MGIYWIKTMTLERKISLGFLLFFLAYLTIMLYTWRAD